MVAGSKKPPPITEYFVANRLTKELLQEQEMKDGLRREGERTGDSFGKGRGRYPHLGS